MVEQVGRYVFRVDDRVVDLPPPPPPYLTGEHAVDAASSIG